MSTTNNSTDQKKEDEQKRVVQLSEIPGTYILYNMYYLFLIRFRD